MSKPGRPRALDDIKQREIIALVSSGCGVETAARYVGCSARTIYRETRRNKEFWERFRKAELASALSPLQTIQRAAHENWRAATWLLERKLPQHFAPTHRDMIDPEDLGQILDRFMEEICRNIPDKKARDRIVKRIEQGALVAVHEATTNRKNPKHRRRHSPLSDLPPGGPASAAPAAGWPSTRKPKYAPPPPAFPRPDFRYANSGLPVENADAAPSAASPSAAPLSTPPTENPAP
ncbi:MAG TPA: helix-turn-helix domain-containing protein [Pirellulales bacterium]|jgi:hypothetical protein|nr:helix-turn-helix domain-containing protein [Pirellulales bacterium]